MAGDGVGLSEVLRQIWRHEFDVAARDGGIVDYGEVWRRIADRYEEARAGGAFEQEDTSRRRSRSWARGERAWPVR